MVAKNVFSDSDDEIKITILDKNIVDDENTLGTPIPFQTNGVTKMILYRFDDNSVIANSSLDNRIAYDDNGGITLKLGDVVMVKFRSIDTYIKAFSPTKPLGQTIVHSKRADSNLSITFN